MATGGAARRRSRPTRNPWKRDPSFCLPAPAGAEEGACEVLIRRWPAGAWADPAVPSSTPPGWGIERGAVTHGFRSPAAHSTRGYGPAPLRGGVTAPGA